MSFYIWALIAWVAIAIVFFLTKEIADYFGLTFGEIIQYIICAPLFLILLIFCIIACPFLYIYKKVKSKKEK